MIPDVDPLEHAAELFVRLSAAGIRCAVGGSLAYNVWAVPRGTADVDLDVHAPPDDCDAVLDALGVVDVTDRTRAASQARADGQFRVTLRGMRICVFLAADVPLFDEVFDHHTREIALERMDGTATVVRFLDASAISLFKLLFFRPKDQVDLDRLFGVGDPTLDVAWIRGWLLEYFDEEDARAHYLSSRAGGG